MDGAVWRDPERMDEWIGELSKEEPVVIFCVYGFHVGCEDGRDAPQGGLRRQLHGGRALRLEGGEGADETLSSPPRHRRAYAS